MSPELISFYRKDKTQDMREREIDAVTPKECHGSKISKIRTESLPN
jgi:hypothetical protein